MRTFPKLPTFSARRRLTSWYKTLSKNWKLRNRQHPRFQFPEKFRYDGQVSLASKSESNTPLGSQKASVTNGSFQAYSEHFPGKSPIYLMLRKDFSSSRVELAVEIDPNYTSWLKAVTLTVQSKSSEKNAGS
jgi:hypothetical protein